MSPVVPRPHERRERERADYLAEQARLAEAGWKQLPSDVAEMIGVDGVRLTHCTSLEEDILSGLMSIRVLGRCGVDHELKGVIPIDTLADDPRLAFDEGARELRDRGCSICARPPPVLCSQCGSPMELADAGAPVHFACVPCGREVTA